MTAVEPYDPNGLLRKYKNIVLFSCKGSRSPMSLLGGGDYDGSVPYQSEHHGMIDSLDLLYSDTVTVVWEPAIVEPFKNADIEFADPPPGFIADNFEEQKETVASFCEKHKALTEDERAEIIQREYLLASLDDQGLVGRYSKWQVRLSVFVHS